MQKRYGMLQDRSARQRNEQMVHIRTLYVYSCVHTETLSLYIETYVQCTQVRVNMYGYMIYIYIYIHVSMYVFRENERERERQRKTGTPL